MTSGFVTLIGRPNAGKSTPNAGHGLRKRRLTTR
jgi:hypothetical protein